MLEKTENVWEPKTQLDPGVVLKPINVEEMFGKSPSTGSTKRLMKYQSDLATSRGKNRGFDKPMLETLLMFAKDPQQVRDVESYLNELRDPDGYLFSRNLKLYSATSAAWIKFQEHDHTSFRWNINYQKSLEELRRHFSQYNFGVYRYTNDESMLEVLPKTDTHSGFLYLETGKKKKGDNMEGMFERYIKERRLALRRGTFSKPILVANRTQASGEFEDDGSMTGTCKHKTRVVSMIDLRVILAELEFFHPFQRAMSDWDEYAGYKDVQRQMQIIQHNARFCHFSQFMSIDYSSFDQTISSWLIEDAFSIVRCAFRMTPADEKLFDVIVHDFIHKRFVLADGILESHKGVPSGSMFTQVIDSIVNVLVVKTYFNSIHERCKTFVMGDDNVIFAGPKASLDDMASYIMKNFGLIIKVDLKTNCGSLLLSDVRVPIGFLSRYWYWWDASKIYKHPNQIISRLLYPERFRNYNSQAQPEDVLWSYRDSFGAGVDEFVDLFKLSQHHPRSQSRIDNLSDHLLSGYSAYSRSYLVERKS